MVRQTGAADVETTAVLRESWVTELLAQAHSEIEIKLDSIMEYFLDASALNIARQDAAVKPTAYPDRIPSQASW